MASDKKGFSLPGLDKLKKFGLGVSSGGGMAAKTSARGQSSAKFNVRDVGNLSFGKRTDYTTPAVIIAVTIGGALLIRRRK